MIERMNSFDFLELIQSDKGYQFYGRLLEDCGEPTDVHSVGTIETRIFANQGFSIDYSIVKSRFCGVFFHLFTESVREHSVTRFTSVLPFGIKAIDSKQVVELKLGKEPYFSSHALSYTGSETEYVDKYEIGIFRILVSFDSISGSITSMGVFDRSCY